MGVIIFYILEIFWLVLASLVTLIVIIGFINLIRMIIQEREYFKENVISYLIMFFFFSIMIFFSVTYIIETIQKVIL